MTNRIVLLLLFVRLTFVAGQSSTPRPTRRPTVAQTPAPSISPAPFAGSGGGSGNATGSNGNATGSNGNSTAPSPTPQPVSHKPHIDTLAPTMFYPKDCWDNTTQVFMNLYQQKPYSKNTYILCPNTVYKIGYSVNNQCCKDGDIPLLGRANTHYLCGKDGKSSNNCTLIAGSLHVMLDEILFSEPTIDVLIQGFTFQSAGSYVTLPSSQGNFTFKDCIFQDNKNLGPVVMIHYPSPVGGRRRALLDKKEKLRGTDVLTKLDFLTSDEYIQAVQEISEEYKDGTYLQAYIGGDDEDGEESLTFDYDRDLASSSAVTYTELTGNFVDCIFQNNQQGPTSGFTTYGILTSMEPRNYMNFDSCLFQNNDYGAANALDGYAIKSDSSSVSIMNSCFMNNNFVGIGTVQALNGTTVHYKNVYGTSDSGLQCLFVASQPISLNPNDVTCMDYDASSCGLSLYQTPAPSAAPVSASAPSPSTSTPPATPTGTSAAGHLQSIAAAVTIVAVSLLINE